MGRGPPKAFDVMPIRNCADGPCEIRNSKRAVDADLARQQKFGVGIGPPALLAGAIDCHSDALSRGGGIGGGAG